MPRHKTNLYQFDQYWLCTYLQEEYWKNERSVNNIAKDFDITGQTILVWMRKLGINRRTFKESANILSERKRRSAAVKGILNPMKRPDVTAKFLGELNPAKRPEVGAKISIKLTGRIITESWRKNLSVANTGKTRSSEVRKIISINTSGCKNPAWLGGISYLPYCPKFNIVFKEYIRNMFGRKCFICGKTEEENGQCLSIHHINYDKLTDCKYTKLFIPVCISHNTKFNKNKWYWFNLLINYWCMNNDIHFMKEVVCDLGVVV